MDGKKPSPKSPEERVEHLLNRREREEREERDRAASAEGSTSAADGSPAEGNSPAAGNSPTAGRSPAAGGASPDRSAPAASGASADRSAPRGRAPLTEKQRIEARRLRREKRRGRGRGRASSRRRPGASESGAGSRSGSGVGVGGGNPLSRGVRATAREVRRAAGFLLATLLAGLDRLGPILSSLGSAASSLASGAGRSLAALSRATGRALGAAGALLLSVERLMTPRRAAFAVAGAGVVVLAISQFIDFRAIEVGRSGYSAVQEIARAPRIEVQTPMDAHSVLLLAVGLAAAGCLAGLALTGRRIFALGLSVTGLMTIAVALVIDLPKGLDTEEAAIAFTGVAAVLLAGFWLQVAAGVVLATTGMLLAVVGTGRGSPTRTSRPRRAPATREPRDTREPREPLTTREPRDAGRSVGPGEPGSARTRSVREKPA